MKRIACVLFALIVIGVFATESEAACCRRTPVRNAVAKVVCVTNNMACCTHNAVRNVACRMHCRLERLRDRCCSVVACCPKTDCCPNKAACPKNACPKK